MLTRALCLDEDPDLYAVEVRYAGVAAVRYDEAGVYLVTAGLYVDVAGGCMVKPGDPLMTDVSAMPMFRICCS